MNTTEWNSKLREVYKMYKSYGYQVTLCDLMLGCDVSKVRAEQYIEQAIYHYQGETRK